MKAQGFYVEGTEIKIPSHVTLVEGIDTYVGASIAAYDNSVDSKINALANVYVGKTQKASAASFADTSTYAAKAYDFVLGGCREYIFAKTGYVIEPVSRPLGSMNDMNG